MKKAHKQSGITLVALIVTIVVLIILVGITINTLFSDDGVINKAIQAKEITKKTEVIESIQSDIIGKQALKKGENITRTEFEEILEKYTEGGADGIQKDDDGNITEMKVEGLTETIKIAEIYKGEFASDFIGYYADLNGDGKITAEADGIIYADLAVGGSREWNSNSWSGYSYEAVTSGLKKYCINGTYTDTYFGERQIIKEVDGTRGNDRFYVMSLSNFTTASNTTFCWYYSALADKQLTKTKAYVAESTNDFGKGKENTAEMVEAWNKTTYGSQNGDSSHPDMWGRIQSKVNEGWFVPSKSEWAAFGDALEITKTNYREFDFGYSYWSSSVSSYRSAYRASFDKSSIDTNNVATYVYVRLSTTF